MRLGDMPLASLDDIDFADAKFYACRDADGTCRLEPILSSRLRHMSLESTYRLELDTYHLLDRMMMVGVRPDLPHFARLSFKLQGEIETLRYKLEKATGLEGFNANSGDQVADYLFGTLGLPEYKRTSPDGRASTNDKILEALEHEFGLQHPEISLTRKYRETYKLKHTFVDRIPDFTARWPHDGRVHFTIRTTRVVTGRLAASDPNFLAQPEHGQFAKDFKDGWVAEDGHVLAAWDESQIELRVLAHLSQDPYMMGVFRGDIRNPDGSLIDLHAALAQRIFGVPPDQQDKSKHRLPAKAINFGIPMGMTVKGLTLELRKNGLMVDEDDVQKWLDEADRTYARVPEYKKRMIAEAKANGFVRCLSGRIRYIGGIKSWDERIRSEAERFAFSTPIQEGAQFLMKMAEKEVWKLLCLYRRKGFYAEPLVQKHDALYFELAEGLQFNFNEHMRYCMVDAVEHNLSVPLDIEGEWGHCLGPKWDERKVNGKKERFIRNERGMEAFE